MSEKLLGWIYHWDGTYLWCYDEKICTLSRTDINTMNVICAISPVQILKGEWYEVGNLIGWGDKLIIIPQNIEKEWVIYDKQNGHIEYGIFCSEKQLSVAGAVLRNNLILFPASVSDPILVIDLQKREIIKKISLQDYGLVPEHDMVILDTKLDKGDICFLIRNSCYYGRINDTEFQLTRIQAGVKLECADFYGDTGWAVDHGGKVLYQFDKAGNLLGELSINVGTEFGRIAVENKKIFLLPVNQSQLWAFDVDKNQIKEIDVQQKETSFSILETFGSAGYWGYVKNGQNMWFLPWRYPLQILNIDTLICSQADFLYTDNFSKKEYVEYREYVQRLKRPIYYETASDKTIEKYLALVKEKNFTLGKTDEEYFGKKIWKKFK